MALKVVPQEWIVDGLLRVGRKRISLLAGKPESGKSCIGRQLTVAVAKGLPFFGRKTVRGSVLLWQTEELPEDVQASLRCLGYDADTDENILVFNGDASENTVEALDEALKQHPSVRLVIIETPSVNASTHRSMPISVSLGRPAGATDTSAFDPQ